MQRKEKLANAKKKSRGVVSAQIFPEPMRAEAYLQKPNGEWMFSGFVNVYDAPAWRSRNTRSAKATA